MDTLHDSFLFVKFTYQNINGQQYIIYIMVLVYENHSKFAKSRYGTKSSHSKHYLDPMVILMLYTIYNGHITNRNGVEKNVIG